MKARRLLLFAALCSCVIPASSAFAQKLYPVQGPLAAQSPQPVLPGHIRRPIFGPGPFMLLKSWTLANGEIVQGKAKKLKATSANMPAPQKGEISLPQPNLAFAWDAVYGEGYFVANILGNEFGQAVFTNNKGTVLQVESFDGRNGVAVDNRGNIYKLVW